MITARVRTGGWLAGAWHWAATYLSANAHNGSVFLFSYEFGASVTLAAQIPSTQGIRI